MISALGMVQPQVEPSANSSAMSNEQAPILDFPLRGEWKLVHSLGHDQYAFDLVRLDPATGQELRVSWVRHLLGLATVEDSYSWGQPVYAPVSGTAVIVGDNWPDRERLSLLRDVGAMVFSRPQLSPDDLRPFAGNHVILESEEHYVFMAHFRHGSLQVQEGDHVEAGQLIAEVGNSGFSLKPHLHLQLMDQIEDVLQAEAPPFNIRHFERWDGGEWQDTQIAPLNKGDRVRFMNE